MPNSNQNVQGQSQQNTHQAVKTGLNAAIDVAQYGSEVLLHKVPEDLLPIRFLIKKNSFFLDVMKELIADPELNQSPIENLGHAVMNATINYAIAAGLGKVAGSWAIPLQIAADVGDKVDFRKVYDEELPRLFAENQNNPRLSEDDKWERELFLIELGESRLIGIGCNKLSELRQWVKDFILNSVRGEKKQEKNATYDDILKDIKSRQDNIVQGLIASAEPVYLGHIKKEVHEHQNKLKHIKENFTVKETILNQEKGKPGSLPNPSHFYEKLPYRIATGVKEIAGIFYKISTIKHNEEMDQLKIDNLQEEIKKTQRQMNLELDLSKFQGAYTLEQSFAIVAQAAHRSYAHIIIENENLLKNLSEKITSLESLKASRGEWSDKWLQNIAAVESLQDKIGRRMQRIVGDSNQGLMYSAAVAGGVANIFSSVPVLGIFTNLLSGFLNNEAQNDDKQQRRYTRLSMQLNQMVGMAKSYQFIVAHNNQAAAHNQNQIAALQNQVVAIGDGSKIYRDKMQEFIKTTSDDKAKCETDKNTAQTRFDAISVAKPHHLLFISILENQLSHEQSNHKYETSKERDLKKDIETAKKNLLALELEQGRLFVGLKNMGEYLKGCELLIQNQTNLLNEANKVGEIKDWWHDFWVSQEAGMTEEEKLDLTREHAAQEEAARYREEFKKRFAATDNLFQSLLDLSQVLRKFDGGEFYAKFIEGSQISYEMGKLGLAMFETTVPRLINLFEKHGTDILKVITSFGGVTEIINQILIPGAGWAKLTLKLAMLILGKEPKNPVIENLKRVSQSLHQQLTVITENLTTLNNKVDGISAKLDVISKQIGHVSHNVNEVNGKLDKLRQDLLLLGNSLNKYDAYLLENQYKFINSQALKDYQSRITQAVQEIELKAKDENYLAYLATKLEHAKDRLYASKELEFIDFSIIHPSRRPHLFIDFFANQAGFDKFPNFKLFYSIVHHAIEYLKNLEGEVFLDHQEAFYKICKITNDASEAIMAIGLTPKFLKTQIEAVQVAYRELAEEVKAFQAKQEREASHILKAQQERQRKDKILKWSGDLINLESKLLNEAFIGSNKFLLSELLRTELGLHTVAIKKYEKTFYKSPLENALVMAKEFANKFRLLEIVYVGGEFKIFARYFNRKDSRKFDNYLSSIKKIDRKFDKKEESLLKSLNGIDPCDVDYLRIRSNSPLIFSFQTDQENHSWTQAGCVINGNYSSLNGSYPSGLIQKNKEISLPSVYLKSATTQKQLEEKKVAISEFKKQYDSEVKKLLSSYVGSLKRILSANQVNLDHINCEINGKAIKDARLIFPKNESLLPILLPSQFLNKIGLGSAEVEYSIVIDEKNKEFAFVLNYGGEPFTIFKVDLFTVQCFAKMNAQAQFLNLNEFLIIALYGSPQYYKHAGLANKSSILLNDDGDFSISESPFVGMYSLLDKLPHTTTFKFNHHLFSDSVNEIFEKYLAGKLTIAAIKEFLCDENKVEAKVAEKSPPEIDFSLAEVEKANIANFKKVKAAYELLLTLLKLLIHADDDSCRFLLKEHLNILDPTQLHDLPITDAKTLIEVLNHQANLVLDEKQLTYVYDFCDANPSNFISDFVRLFHQLNDLNKKFADINAGNVPDNIEIPPASTRFKPKLKFKFFTKQVMQSTGADVKSPTATISKPVEKQLSFDDSWSYEDKNINSIMSIIYPPENFVNNRFLFRKQFDYFGHNTFVCLLPTVTVWQNNIHHGIPLICFFDKRIQHVNILEFYNLSKAGIVGKYDLFDDIGHLLKPNNENVNLNILFPYQFDNHFLSGEINIFKRKNEFIINIYAHDSFGSGKIDEPTYEKLKFILFNKIKQIHQNYTVEVNSIISKHREIRQHDACSCGPIVIKELQDLIKTDAINPEVYAPGCMVERKKHLKLLADAKVNYQELPHYETLESPQVVKPNLASKANPNNLFATKSAAEVGTADRFYQEGLNYYFGRNGLDKNYAHAAAAFRLALKKDPKHQPSLYSLGWIYEVHDRDLKSAYDLYQRALFAKQNNSNETLVAIGERMLVIENHKDLEEIVSKHYYPRYICGVIASDWWDMRGLQYDKSNDPWRRFKTSVCRVLSQTCDENDKAMYQFNDQDELKMGEISRNTKKF